MSISDETIVLGIEKGIKNLFLYFCFLCSLFCPVQAFVACEMILVLHLNSTRCQRCLIFLRSGRGQMHRQRFVVRSLWYFVASCYLMILAALADVSFWLCTA